MGITVVYDPTKEALQRGLTSLGGWASHFADRQAQKRMFYDRLAEDVRRYQIGQSIDRHGNTAAVEHLLQSAPFGYGFKLADLAGGRTAHYAGAIPPREGGPPPGAESIKHLQSLLGGGASPLQHFDNLRTVSGLSDDALKNLPQEVRDIANMAKSFGVTQNTGNEEMIKLLQGNIGAVGNQTAKSMISGLPDMAAVENRAIEDAYKNNAGKYSRDVLRTSGKKSEWIKKTLDQELSQVQDASGVAAFMAAGPKQLTREQAGIWRELKKFGVTAENAPEKIKEWNALTAEKENATQSLVDSGADSNYVNDAVGIFEEYDSAIKRGVDPVKALRRANLKFNALNERWNMSGSFGDYFQIGKGSGPSGGGNIRYVTFIDKNGKKSGARIRMWLGKTVEENLAIARGGSPSDYSDGRESVSRNEITDEKVRKQMEMADIASAKEAIENYKKGVSAVTWADWKIRGVSIPQEIRDEIEREYGVKVGVDGTVKLNRSGVSSSSSADEEAKRLNK